MTRPEARAWFEANGWPAPEDAHPKADTHAARHWYDCAVLFDKWVLELAGENEQLAREVRRLETETIELKTRIADLTRVWDPEVDASLPRFVRARATRWDRLLCRVFGHSWLVWSPRHPEACIRCGGER